MLKLMKYEFRKQAFSKGVILALLGLVEVLFGYSVIFDNENVLGTSVFLLTMLSFASLIFVAYESIITFSKDLKEKCSYMLFLVPKSTYSIIGAKVLSAGIQVIAVGLLFLAVSAVDFSILVAKYSSLAEITDKVRKLISAVIAYDINGSDVFLAFFNVLLNWISIITVAFFSITLSTTFLANKKFKGVVSFIIFVVLNYLFGLIVRTTIGDQINYTQTKIILDCLYYICFTIITYFGTGYMLDKKVSV
ncbi:hypothetical protein [Anaeromicropila herbilytica]|uniref:Uncharacterized protein n=1 Tax=Anaeromicropila herbilytica TaxID=2785025 RepID=A0A7R7EKA1_9FIRM|nr:hypothetical protein [Anaeromicropila herbilytica]BCN30360.1 hypothetical protein bsdtb5_16550 [Anaeromicropila herbilytica]